VPSTSAIAARRVRGVECGRVPRLQVKPSRLQDRVARAQLNPPFGGEIRRAPQQER
jgi:hypothetical protein